MVPRMSPVLDLLILFLAAAFAGAAITSAETAFTLSAWGRHLAGP